MARVALVAVTDSMLARAVVDRLVADGVHVAVVGHPIVAATLVFENEAAGNPVDRVIAELGALDLLVCSVGLPAALPFRLYGPGEWFAAVDAALSPVFRLVRAAVPALRLGGDGRILMVGAGWGATERPNSTAAAAVHGGVVAFVKTLARDLGPDCVSVNEIAVAPGSSGLERAAASAVSYLAGPHGGAVTGQVLTLGRGGEIRP